MLRLFIFSILILIAFSFQRCYQCLGGGRIIATQDYILNSCGLNSGLIIEEIKVDSFLNKLPSKYSMQKWARLYDANRKLNDIPKKLYYDKHCDTINILADTENIDKIQCPFVFNKNSWYKVYSSDARTIIFIYVDNNGKKISYDPY